MKFCLQEHALKETLITAHRGLSCANIPGNTQISFEAALAQGADMIELDVTRAADGELILVDDGSPDGCPQLCDRLAAKDARIRVIHKENGGLSSARNAGMAAAQGKYIWWVDSDDWIESGALQRLYDETHETFPDVVKFSHYRSGAEITQVKSCVQPGV